jgi:hypothetical protein
VKATYVGPLPKPAIYSTYVAFTVTVPLPTQGLAKELPPLPAGHTERWTLYATLKQWRRVELAFRQDPQERAIAEGIAVVQSHQNILYVTALKAVSIERARQAQQKAAAVEVSV